MEALEAILTRRSTRKFRAEMPGRELIDRIIEAGRHAPSGGNNQTTHFIVITNPAKLAELAMIVREEFAKMDIYPGMYRSKQNAINAAKKGTLLFHYNAPVLIVVANRTDYSNAMADSACALENMMIAANALDMGSCWVDQLHWLDGNEVIMKYLGALGLEEDETITGGLVLGFADTGAEGGDLPVRTALPRTGNPVTWVE